MNVRTKTGCRVCGSELPSDNVLNFGVKKIADWVLPGEQDKGQAPLELVLCPSCELLQLRHTVEQDALFKKFWYRSGTSELMREALKDVVAGVCKRVDLKLGDEVLDIGCNDGTLLSFYKPGIQKFGVDPCAKLIEEAFVAGRITGGVTGYFSAKTCDTVTKYKAVTAVTAVAMFYDLDDPLAFCKDVRQVIADDGLFVIQINYLPAMLRNCAFDNICHEHLCYYSLTTLVPVLERADFVVTDVEFNEVNGGSFRVYAQPIPGLGKCVSVSMQKLSDALRDEETFFKDPLVYQNFSRRVLLTCYSLQTLLETLMSQRKKIFGYGASTRGCTLLQCIDGDKLTEVVAIAERDENKVGRWMVGIPIVSEAVARKEADYFLILPWHLWPAIQKREEQWMRDGGKCILPLPAPKIAGFKYVGIGGSAPIEFVEEDVPVSEHEKRAGA